MKKKAISIFLALSLILAMAAPALAAAENTVDEPETGTGGSDYRLVSASKYTDGEQTDAYELVYDAAGDSLPGVIRRTLPTRSYEETYTYLGDGRVLTCHRENDDGTAADTNFYYDGEGKLVLAVEKTPSQSYDADGNPSGHYTYTTYSKYAYNDTGELVSVTDMDDFVGVSRLQEYTYTDGRMTDEKDISYDHSFDGATGEEVTEYKYTYDNEGRKATRESYENGEQTFLSEYAYNGILYIVKASSGYISANLLNGSDYQMMSIGFTSEAGEQELIYDDAGRLVRFEAPDGGTYVELAYEDYSPASAEGADEPAVEVLSDVVMLDNEYCTLSLEYYFAPYMFLAFTNKSPDSVYYLYSNSVICNGLGMPLRLLTEETQPGQTTECMLTLEPDTLKRFGVNYVEDLTIVARLEQVEDGMYRNAASGLTASVELPAPADADGPSMLEPVFSIDPIEVMETDAFKVSIVDVSAESVLHLMVYFEDYTGQGLSVGVNELSVNGTPLSMPPFGLTLGNSDAERGYMDGVAAYMKGDFYSSDLSALLEEVGPLQTIDVTLSVFQQGADYSSYTTVECPPVTIQF